MHNISITKAARAIMYQDAVEAFPNECCGFLYGKDGAVRQITIAQAVINSQTGDKRRRFEISPFDYMKAEQYALTHDLTLLGVYHSHPNHPAIPSIHDLQKALPYFSYIIISVLDGKVNVLRSWRLNEETKQFDEEKII